MKIKTTKDIMNYHIGLLKIPNSVEREFFFRKQWVAIDDVKREVKKAMDKYYPLKDIPVEWFSELSKKLSSKPEKE